MKKILLFIGVTFIAFACSKDEANSNPPEHVIKYSSLSAPDPVVEHYSQYGSIERMPATYEGQSDNVCSNHSAIYQYIPDAGPFQGLICEIYRFDESSDISGPCDETFDKDKDEVQVGNIKYTHCPDDGGNCKELDMPWGCTLVFCDDDEVDS